MTCLRDVIISYESLLLDSHGAWEGMTMTAGLARLKCSAVACVRVLLTVPGASVSLSRDSCVMCLGYMSKSRNARLPRARPGKCLRETGNRSLNIAFLAMEA